MGNIRATVVATRLPRPWSIASWTKTMLVTERAGELRVTATACSDPAPVWIAPPAPGDGPPGTSGGDALHAVIAHPKFATNGWVYVTHTKVGERGETLAIERARFDGKRLVEMKEIFVADAWEKSGTSPGGCCSAQTVSLRNRRRSRSPVLHRQGRQ